MPFCGIITEEYANIARKSDVNIVSRVAFLRKLCELNGRQGEWGEAYEILSCLVHASGIRRKLANDTYVDMDDAEIEKGMSKIKEFIPFPCVLVNMHFLLQGLLRNV